MGLFCNLTSDLLPFLTLALGAVDNLCVPRHLDSLQLRFIRLRGIVFKVRQRGHILVQVCEADGERIDFRVRFGEQNSDVFGIAPGKFFGMKNCSYWSFSQSSHNQSRLKRFTES